MSAHNPDVAAVLAERLPHGWADDYGVAHNEVSKADYKRAQNILAALTAATS